MTAPDLTTEVVGYRQWYITPELELRSCGLRAERWTRGNATAVCRRMRYPDPYAHNDEEPKPDPCGDCPGEDCECGFYALHDPSDHWYGGRRGIGVYMMNGYAETDTLVSGIIVAWGAMQVHHQGFRAQHARIAALALPQTKRDQAVARAAASAYGVPCVPSEELPRIAAEYGGTVPHEFRPEKPEPPMELGYTQALSSMWGTTYAQAFSAWLLVPAAGSRQRPAVAAPGPSTTRTRAEFIQALAQAKRPQEMKAIKPGANRQGPPRPKRAPKKLGGR